MRTFIRTALVLGTLCSSALVLADAPKKAPAPAADKDKAPAADADKTADKAPASDKDKPADASKDKAKTPAKSTK
ncbi:MAG TPA: hypothetical protein VGM88_07285 [Kofleriaceae bacterium]|jgi:hypothetical protein